MTDAVWEFEYDGTQVVGDGAVDEISTSPDRVHQHIPLPFSESLWSRKEIWQEIVEGALSLCWQLVLFVKV